MSGEPYNIGNINHEISVIDLADLFLELSESKSSKDIVDYPDTYPADEPMRRCPDIKKARTQLNFNPKVDIKEGVKKFFSWTNQNYSQMARPVKIASLVDNGQEIILIPHERWRI